MDPPSLIEEEILTLIRSYLRKETTVVLTETNIRPIVETIINNLRVDSSCFRLIQKIGPDWNSYVDYERILSTLQG